MLETHIAGTLQAKFGDVLKFYQTFSEMLSPSTDFGVTKVVNPSQVTLQPLTAKVIDLCEITNAKIIFIKTTKPIHVTMVFAPTAPTPAPVPPTSILFVQDFLYLVTEISALTITNPNSGTVDVDAAIVDLLLVGE